jgi:enoyl-CoA hydratase/carnithine racemase
VKDALPKAVLFDLIYRARLMPAAEACAMRIVSEVVPRAAVLDRAVEIAEQAAAHRPEIVALGRGLYYQLRGAPPEKALEVARRALIVALATVDRD